MSAARTETIELPDDAATRQLARDMAKGLSARDTLWLSGPIGAGKTEFSRALIRARAGQDIDVPSPSFTLLQTYDLPDLRIAHVDLYRLADASEIAELGLEDLAEDHLLVIEWPERGGDALARPTLSLTFEIAGDARRLQLCDMRGAVDA